MSNRGEDRVRFSGGIGPCPGSGGSDYFKIALRGRARCVIMEKTDPPVKQGPKGPILQLSPFTRALKDSYAGSEKSDPPDPASPGGGAA
jgi:hypothetical protein